MTHFEDYRWEDRVPRKGDWQFSLVAGALAFGLLAAALPEPQDDRWVAASPSGEPASRAVVTGFDIPRRDATASVFRVADEQGHCLGDTRSVLAGS